MDKGRPTYNLEEVKASIRSASSYWITKTAWRDAVTLGIGEEEICDIVNGIKNSDFYKSMSTNDDHTAWQDVYHVTSEIKGHTITLYVKFQINRERGNYFIVSFKEK